MTDDNSQEQHILSEWKKRSGEGVLFVIFMMLMVLIPLILVANGWKK